MSAAASILAHSMGLSNLFRAIVALPTRLTERNQPLQERVVFFVIPSRCESAARHLERLLSQLWHEDTTEWCEHGYLYNVTAAGELMSRSLDDATPANPDLHLFEIGWGGPDGIGPQHVHYARAADCDLLVPPRLHKRLAIALAQIEALYSASSKVRQ